MRVAQLIDVGLVFTDGCGAVFTIRIGHVEIETQD